MAAEGSTTWPSSPGCSRSRGLPTSPGRRRPTAVHLKGHPILARGYARISPAMDPTRARTPSRHLTGRMLRWAPATAATRPLPTQGHRGPGRGARAVSAPLARAAAAHAPASIRGRRHRRTGPATTRQVHHTSPALLIAGQAVVPGLLPVVVSLLPNVRIEGFSTPMDGPACRRPRPCRDRLWWIGTAGPDSAVHQCGTRRRAGGSSARLRPTG